MSSAGVNAGALERDALIERVAAITDPCAQAGLIRALQLDLAGGDELVGSVDRPDEEVLATLIWQQHFLYAFAGLAGQWPLAQWSREGAQLAVRLRSGEVGWESVRVLFEDWQQRGRVLSSTADGGCLARLSRKDRELRASLLRWITDAAAESARSGEMAADEQ